MVPGQSYVTTAKGSRSEVSNLFRGVLMVVNCGRVMQDSVLPSNTQQHRQTLHQPTLRDCKVTSAER